MFFVDTTTRNGSDNENYWNGCSCLDKMDDVFLNILHKGREGSTSLVEILKVAIMQQAMINS